MSAISIDGVLQEPFLIEKLKKITFEYKCSIKQSLENLKKTAIRYKNNKKKKEIEEKINQVHEYLTKFQSSIGYKVKIKDEADFNSAVKTLEKYLEEIITYIKSTENNLINDQLEESLNNLLSKEKDKPIEENKTEIKDINLISKVKNIPVEKLKKLPSENIENLKEETLLILEKKKEEANLQSLYKISLKTYEQLVEEKQTKEKIRKLFNQNHISKEEFNKIRDEVIKQLNKETEEAAQEKARENIINELLEKGYIIEEGESQILYINTSDKNYKIMIKISGSKIVSRFVKIVDSEKYKPTEYEKIKDREKMKNWCKDFEKIKEKLREKGIYLENKNISYEIDKDVNYVVSKKEKVASKKLEKSKYMEKK